MRNLKFLAAAAMAIAAMGANAAGQGSVSDAFGPDIATDVSANVSSGYNYRGEQLSQNSPSFGGQLGLSHASGLGLNLKTQSGLLGGDVRFMHSTIGVNFGAEVMPGVNASAGIEHNVFTGFAGSGEVDFTELVGRINYQGLHGSVSYNLAGPESLKGNIYTEVGYTHHFGSSNQFYVGADLGFTIHTGDLADFAEDGVRLAQLRAGVQLKENLDLGVSYQLDIAKDPTGAKANGNSTFGVTLGYKF